jgi:hypothetical protein
LSDLASLKLVFAMYSLVSIDDRQSACLSGGRAPSRFAGLQLFGWLTGAGGQTSGFTQNGLANVINVGNTGTSVVSIGAIYL